MSKPTIVLAPGAWHTPDCYDLARAELHKRGWETEAVAYPSVGAEPPTKGLADDAAAVRSTLERLADAGKEIVLVVHSYGGLVGQNALEGLGYKQRQAAGKKGGVIVFVYLAAFVVPKGGTIKAMLGGQFLPWMKFMVCTIQRSLPDSCIARLIPIVRVTTATLKHPRLCSTTISAMRPRRPPSPKSSTSRRASSPTRLLTSRGTRLSPCISSARPTKRFRYPSSSRWHRCSVLMPRHSRPLARIRLSSASPRRSRTVWSMQPRLARVGSSRGNY